MIGQTLSTFRITAKLGEGGMGEVYLAEDTSLGREVAIKVLPEAFVADPERLARFQREAHLLASLTHPNIAGIHQVGDVDGIHFLVMELARGETLAERIGRGPLPVEEAVATALQVARALEAAHGKGIVHRDLKPANIMVDPDGAVKVLDFGLARAWEEPVEAGSASQSPTLTAQMTQSGALLGTAAYMSPEQAKGRQVDKRTDIWAFGCVLFEMLAGERLFARESVVETLSAILERDPDWTRLPAGLPARYRRLLGRCLVKDRRQRLHDIADARIELEAAPDPEPTFDTAFARAPRARLVPSLAGAALLGALLGVLGTWGLTRWASSPEPATRAPVRRLNLGIPANSPVSGPGESLALSPKGDYFVYVGPAEESTQLFLRRLDRLESEPISGTRGAVSPFVSPDGEWIGFEADGKLKKVSLAGGPTVALCDVQAVRGASWADDGTILFHSGAYLGLFTISEGGGKPRQLTQPVSGEDEGSHRWPQVLPGGRAALFTIQPTGSQMERTRIALVSMETGEYRTVIEPGMHARYSPSGHIVYAREGSLFAVPFDLERLEITGEPLPVISDIRENRGSVKADFDLSPTGSLILLPGRFLLAPRSLVWMGRDGQIEPAAEASRPYAEPAVSPGGDRIAVILELETSRELWVYELRRETWLRLTSERVAYGPEWSPAGDRLAFTWNRIGAYNLYSIAADGSTSPEQLTDGTEWSIATAWLPDGSGILFGRQDAAASSDLWLLRPGEATPEQPLLTGPFWEDDGRVSPDGRWLAYTSNESGVSEVYVRSYPDLGVKLAISSGGGSTPRWAPNGRELFYRSGDRLMHVEIGAGAALGSAIPRSLLDLESDAGSFLEEYDLSPDGRRFVMVYEPRSEAPRPEIVLVPDFAAELRMKLSGG